MAWGAQTPLRFITTNPVTEGYDARAKTIADQNLRDAQLANQDAEFSERVAAAPSRLRQINSAADLNESQARIAKATEGNQIARSAFDTRSAGANATRAETDADVAAKTAGYRIAQEQLQTEGARISNQQAGVNLQQDQQLFPSQLRTSQAQATGAEISTQQAATNLDQDRQLFPSTLQTSQNNAAKSSIELDKAQAWKEEQFFDIADKDPAMALAWARQNGVDIPEPVAQVVNDRRFMAVVSGLRDAIKERYPSPDDAPIRAKEFERIFGNMLKDDTPTEAEAVGMLNDGSAPAPTVTSTTGKGSEFERKRAAWLAVHAGDEQGALEYASGIKHVSDGELWQSAMKQASELVKDDPAFLSEQDGSKRTLILMGRARELFDALKAVPGQDATTNLPNDMTKPPPPVVAAPQAQPSTGAAVPLSAPATPPSLAGRQLQWSPSRKAFRDRTTDETFDAAGNPVR